MKKYIFTKFIGPPLAESFSEFYGFHISKPKDLLFL